MSTKRSHMLKQTCSFQMQTQSTKKLKSMQTVIQNDANTHPHT